MGTTRGKRSSWTAAKVPALLIGSLLNMTAVTNIANRLQAETGANITVVPCGERWSDAREGENGLRPAMEDYLGAGAILSKLAGSKSPEAQVCVGAYYHAEPNIGELLWDCGSGRELREMGFADDVKHAARVDAYQNVPLLRGDHFVNAI